MVGYDTLRSARAKRRLIAVAVLALLAGCAAFPSFDGFSGKVVPSEGGAPSTGDGGEGDGGPNGGSGDGGNACADLIASRFLGGAADAGDFIQLTTEQIGLAGAIASPKTQNLEVFELSFEFSITYAGSFPAAGLAFFAMAGELATIPCHAGPAICVLGSTTAGWGVLLRTSKNGGDDLKAPYLALVDTRALPNEQATSSLQLAAADTWTQIAVPDAGPTLASWRTMTIHRNGPTVDVAINGTKLVSGAEVPGYVKNTAVTWGIGASTGIDTGAARFALRNVSLTCP